MSTGQPAEVTTPAHLDEHLDELIEEATVDCYDEEEQASGFFAIIEDNLALPFTTRILDVDASVAAVEIDDDGRIKAVCERNGERQRIDLIDLPLPSPPPSGAEWVAAYRRWIEGGGFTEEEEEEQGE
jgi:Calcium binding